LARRGEHFWGITAVTRRMGKSRSGCGLCERGSCADGDGGEWDRDVEVKTGVKGLLSQVPRAGAGAPRSSVRADCSRTGATRPYQTKGPRLKPLLFQFCVQGPEGPCSLRWRPVDICGRQEQPRILHLRFRMTAYLGCGLLIGDDWRGWGVGMILNEKSAPPGLKPTQILLALCGG